MNHKRIWLEPGCGNERAWCQDKPENCDECGAPPVEYVRADLPAARTEALEQALREIAGQHIGDCPAALDISDEAWVRRCHDRLRSIARAALAQTGEPTVAPNK